MTFDGRLRASGPRLAGTAERQAAIEFAKAAAMRPQIVGDALQRISQDGDIARAMFEILETQRLLDSKAEITIIPQRSGMIGDLLATGGPGGAR